MSISRNAAYNVAGAALPSVLTLLTVPLYLEIVGLERYGVLTLCWVVLGYSGFLDVGLRMAVARKIAAAPDDPFEAARVFWTSIWLILLLGAAGSALVYVGARLYFGGVAQVARSFQGELSSAMPLLSALVPLGMVSGVLGGALQGRERFLTINALGGLAAALGALLPLLFAYFWQSNLHAILTGALIAQLIPLPISLWICSKAVPFGRPTSPSIALAKEFFSFGGWVSLTVIANGIIQTIDRLTLGSVSGAASVPVYAIPYGLVSRIILIPHSLSSALVPRFAAADQAERQRLASNSFLPVALIITPASVGLITVAEPFFSLWIGSELARSATPIAYVLAGGFWAYSFGHMAYSMLQATGRPDLVSKVLLAELIPFAATLFVCIWAFGAIGAAIAFTLRAVLDCLVFLLLAKIPFGTVRLLLVPALLMFSAVIAGVSFGSPTRYLILIPILLGTIAWSALNVPGGLRAQLRTLARLIRRSKTVENP